MAERITTVETPRTDANHTTIVTESGSRGSGMTWVLGLLVLALIVFGFFMFANNSGSEVARDNAIAGAANSVGEAARDVGDAVKNN